MKPEWCPQCVWDEAEKTIRLASPTYYDYAASVARALLEARKAGMMEAAEIADALSDEKDVAALESRDDLLVTVHRECQRAADQIAAAIRAKAEGMK